jgi:hypothetical protein
LNLGGEGSGQMALCYACLERVVGILRRVFQFIFNIIGKKVMSKEEIIQFTKEFPIPRDRKAAYYKNNNNKKNEIRDGTDLSFSS